MTDEMFAFALWAGEAYLALAGLLWVISRAIERRSPQ